MPSAINSAGLLFLYPLILPKEWGVCLSKSVCIFWKYLMHLSWKCYVS